MKADINDEEIKKICDVIGFPDKPDSLIFSLTIEALFYLCAKDYVKFKKYLRAVLVLVSDRR